MRLGTTDVSLLVKGERASLYPDNYESAANAWAVKRARVVGGYVAWHCQCAWAAARTKNTYRSAQFRRVASATTKISLEITSIALTLTVEAILPQTTRETRAQGALVPIKAA
jgi:hypothetical protein